MMKVKEIAKMASHSPFAKDLHGTPIVPDLVLGGYDYLDQ